MPNNNYPLHPGQTHAEPLYAQIPLEEYERLKEENNKLRSTNEAMRIELEKRGVIVVPHSKDLKKFEKEWVESERKNPSPIRIFQKEK